MAMIFPSPHRNIGVFFFLEGRRGRGNRSIAQIGD